ncbi:MAG: ribosome biogenesis GTP-binding protein YihA/YsxC [Gammaproteobacteria bacterium]
MSLFPNVRFVLSAAQPAQFPSDRGAEIAFAGRSNAGKSSAINAIVQRHGLARVSRTPGRTRLLNFFEVGPDRRIVDLPGYGFAAAPEVERLTWGPMIGALRERESLLGLVLIVDSRRGVAPEDENLIAWARDVSRDSPEPLRVHVLLSKADKLTRSEANKVLKDARAVLGEGATVQLFSVLGKIGIEEAQQVLKAWLA